MPLGVRPPSPPPRRARRRHWRAVEFASLDFETTGLDYARDAVLSFGVVPVRAGRIVVGDAVHQLVVPGIPASAASMKVHHILPQDLAEAGSLDDARRALRAALEGRYVLAWYAGVEMAFLRRIFGGRSGGWRRRTVDVRRLAIELERAHPDVRNTLSATAARYGVPVASPHEALDDALVAAQLFLVLATKLEGRGLGSVGSFLRLTRG